MVKPAVSELALARAWASGKFPARLTTTTGAPVEIVFRGVWTHGLGPDFSGAMIALADGRLLTGSIELHLVTGGWRQHGHYRDPAYNDVILHLVGMDDGQETRRQDGGLVPVVVVGFDAAQSGEQILDWSLVGGSVCAAHLVKSHRALLVDSLHELGDRRLAAKSAQFEAALSVATPAQVIWRALLDALGYTMNRAGMTELSERLPIALLERELSLARDRRNLARALLLGTAGFLPLTAREAGYAAVEPAAIAEIEREWMSARSMVDRTMRPAAWETIRVRPANHPVPRLLAAAALLAAGENGLTSLVLELLHATTSLPDALINIVAENGAQLGRDRAIALSANVVIPFALALGSQTGNDDLVDRASVVWTHLPASAPNQITRSALRQVTGGASLRGLGERGVQGLIHLHRALCIPRRCFECPVARLALAMPGGQPGSDSEITDECAAEET